MDGQWAESMVSKTAGGLVELMEVLKVDLMVELMVEMQGGRREVPVVASRAESMVARKVLLLAAKKVAMKVDLMAAWRVVMKVVSMAAWWAAWRDESTAEMMVDLLVARLVGATGFSRVAEMAA